MARHVAIGPDSHRVDEAIHATLNRLQPYFDSSGPVSFALHHGDVADDEARLRAVQAQRKHGR